MSQHQKLCTFEDLLTPEQRLKIQEGRISKEIHDRFDQEVGEATDAIVRYYNEGGNESKLSRNIYTFQCYLDSYNQRGPHYRYWMQWLQNIMEMYPQLPKMVISLPTFDDYKECRKPAIVTEGI